MLRVSTFCPWSLCNYNWNMFYSTGKNNNSNTGGARGGPGSHALAPGEYARTPRVPGQKIYFWVFSDFSAYFFSHICPRSSYGIYHECLSGFFEEFAGIVKKKKKKKVGKKSKGRTRAAATYPSLLCTVYLHNLSTS